MHSYSIPEPRWRKIGYLMLITIVLIEPVNMLLVMIFEYIPVVDVGSISPAIPTMTIFSLLYILWNNFLWNAPIISRFTAPPDLSGEWYGELDSSHYQGTIDDFATDGGQKNHGPKMVIKQTWTRISVTTYFKNSTSVSTTASFIQDMSDPVLRITYRNTPGGNSSESMTMHTGTNDLRYRVAEDGEYLGGKYYTDEHRNNHGDIRLKKAE